jgi:hypothetical protein
VQREAEEALEALQSSTAWAQDLVLGDVDGSSLPVTSMSTVVERLESQIDVAVANGVRWGSRSALVATMLHFPELDTDLEVLVFGRCTRLIEDEVDSLWSRVHAIADSLASLIPSSVACNAPNSTGE